MFKRVFASVLASAILVVGIAGCGGKASTESEAGGTSAQQTVSSQVNKYEKEIKVTAIQSATEIVNVKDDQLAKKLKEKFNLVIDKTRVINSEYLTKMSLLLASGEAPDFYYSLRTEWKLNEWIGAGYVKGFTVDEIKTKMPNYTKMYTDDEWKTVNSIIKYTDSKLYYFPGKQSSKVNMAWVYRKDTLDSLGLAYPKTTDELYTVLKTIKDKTGKVPYCEASTPTSLWAFTGFLQAFGMPELAIRELSYVDSVTKKFVPYAFSENNYREFLKYMNKLYKDGIIWREFATATTEQVKKFKTQGNGFVVWGYPEKIAEYENISKSAEASAKWDWSKDIISNDPNKIYFKRNVYQNADGVGFNSKISSEKMDRMMDYVNWALSEEGQLLHTFGVEGVTYEMKNGKPVYMDKMISPIKATGEKALEYNIPGAAGFITAHSGVNEVYRPIYGELEKAFLGNRANYYFFVSPAMPYTEDENKKMANITTSINDTREEYAARFIMGQSDPNNDADWKKYIDTLNKLGLEDLKKIRTDTYNRGLK